MNEMKTGAITYIGKLLVQRVLGGAAFFLAAGTLAVPRGILFFLIYIAATIISAMVMYRKNQELLNARRKIATDTKKWDKALLLIYVLLSFYGIYVAAGLSIRFHFAQPSQFCFYIGITIAVMTCFLAVWPVVENRNFESSARIQKDRGQTVCSTGPYAIVRHPGYAAMGLWAMAMPMIFGLLAGMVSVVIGVILVVRTYYEDDMLKQELPGYMKYTKNVRYRLIPHIW